jgi:hypothetical protein
MKWKLLDEVLSRRPSGPLYHYTSSAGFMGIVGKAEIWATHTQYLNDHREYRHAVDKVREQIQAQREFGDPSHRRILDEMRDGLEGIESMNVCVCSFSEARDSLSQWRAYCGGSSGFSIGFSGEFIKAVADQNCWYLAPCIYDPKEQSDLVSALVSEVLEQNIARAAAPEEHDYMPPGGNLNAYLHRFAPILKDCSFRDEKEWRLISRPLMCSNGSFDFRDGNSMLIPYYKLRLAERASALNLHEVVVGPTPHPEQSAMSVGSFLVRHDLHTVSVENSAVPYRSW